MLDYIEKNKAKWKSEVEIYTGEGFQDAIVLIFGQPKTAVTAQNDTIRFTSAYESNLIKTGGPKTIDAMKPVKKDSQRETETALLTTEDEEGNKQLKYVFDRDTDRRTT